MKEHPAGHGVVCAFNLSARDVTDIFRYRLCRPGQADEFSGPREIYRRQKWFTFGPYYKFLRIGRIKIARLPHFSAVSGLSRETALKLVANPPLRP